MSTQPPTTAETPKISFICDPRGSGKTTRVIDCLAHCPRSRDFQDIEDVSFDEEFKGTMRNVRKIQMHPKMAEHCVAMLGKDIMRRPDVHIPFLLQSAAERMLRHSFDKFGLDDVRDLLYCEVNVMMAVLCMIHDTPIGNIWRVSLRDMPSREGSIEISYTAVNARLINLRAVSEMDRKGVLVGPSIGVTTDDGVCRDALIDLSSYSHNSEELIVIGRDDRYDTYIGDLHYTTYSHVDSPISKTATPHYRLYNITGCINMGDVILNYPVIYARMLKRAYTNNVLEMLPYPGDILHIISLRPELEEFSCGIIRMICHGDRIQYSSGNDLRSFIRSRGSYRIKHVFDNGLYMKTSYTELNHGKNYQWNKIYNEMFN